MNAKWADRNNTVVTNIQCVYSSNTTIFIDIL